jgi:hypothetical protein
MSSDAQPFDLTMVLILSVLLCCMLLTRWGRRGFVGLLSNFRYFFTGRR